MLDNSAPNVEACSSQLTKVIRSREPLPATLERTAERTLERMGLDVSFQVLQSLEPFGTANLETSMVLPGTTMLARATGAT